MQRTRHLQTFSQEDIEIFLKKKNGTPIISAENILALFKERKREPPHFYHKIIKMKFFSNKIMMSSIGCQK